MTQTWALLLDAYRELNSKKLFWITLILSAIVVLACGMAGINEKGITFLHWQFETPFFTTEIMSRANFYKMIFASMAIPIWLTWVATVLALVSTGGIFPDFIASGSIELTLSKPIGRWRRRYVAPVPSSPAASPPRRCWRGCDGRCALGSRLFAAHAPWKAAGRSQGLSAGPR